MLKSLFTGLGLSVSIALFGQSLHSREGIRDDRRDITRVFINGNIVPEPGKKANTLIIRNDRVVAVGNDLRIPKDAVVIDLNGKYVYASFVELHTDYGLADVKASSSGTAPEYERKDGKSAFGWNRAIRADQHAVNNFQHRAAEAKKLRNNGIGVVLTHHHDGIVRGTGALVALANLEEQLCVLSPHTARFFSFEKGSSAQQYPSSQMGSIALLRQTLLDLEWYKKGGRNDEQHLHLEEMMRYEKLPAFFSVQDKLSGLRALELGQSHKLPFIVMGSGDAYQWADEYAAKKARVLIPLRFPETPDLNNPFIARDIGLRELKHWELAPYNARILRDAKVATAFSLREVEKPFEVFYQLAHTGLSEDEILAGLTVNAAQFVGQEQMIGRLRPGMLANFLILDNQLTAAKNHLRAHWILGVHHEVDVKDEFPVAGSYRVGDDYLLELNSNKKFRLIHASKDTINGKYTRSNHRVELSFSLDSIPHQWQMVFSMDGKQVVVTQWLEGSMAPPKTYLTTREKSADEADEDKKPYTVLSPDFDYQTALWRPFQAFGRTAPVAQANVHIRNATVWTLEGSEPICALCDVVFQQGKIRAVGKDLKTPKGAQVIDAEGMHVTPGMIDEHSHIAISRGVNESGSSISSEVRIGDVVNPEDINIYRQLSGGTTSSQLLHGSANTIGGQSALVKLRWGSSAEGMKIENAPGFIKFALGENVKQSNWGERMTVRYPQSRMGVEQFLFEQFHRAQAYAADKSPNKRIDLELEALVEIMNNNRHISCHSYIQSEINMLMKVADSMGFRINTFTHVMEGYKVADKMRAHGAAGSTFSDWWAYKMEVNESIPFNAAAMARAGVTTAINSDDAEMGRRLNQEAGKVLRYGGDDPVEALKMVTLNPAKMLQLDHLIGSIAIGKDADLVIWTDVPLSVYARAEKTFVDGRLMFDRSAHEDEILAMQEERKRILKKVRASASGGAKLASPESEIDNEYHCDTLEEIHFHAK